MPEFFSESDNNILLKKKEKRKKESKHRSEKVGRPLFFIQYIQLNY